MSDPGRWARIEALLDAALDRPADERRTFVLSTCGDDPMLAEEILRILREGERTGGVLDAPAADLGAQLVDPSGALHHLLEQVGPWRLVRELGRGGMGTVYLAERDEAGVRQRVALKLVRPGLQLDDHFVRRFVEERQILASLEHPHIARVLDGGVLAPANLPWYAMEFIEGAPIDRWCDARQLPIDDRLRLFLQVCEAVEHAHERRIVHRDIKPSNIMVTEAGEPRLLDFGIAKLLETEGATPHTALTRTGQRLLTPEYASPEQILGQPVSPATDVYSLGVLLYELLTGRRPYRRGSRSAHALERAVLEERPTPPSRVVTRPGGISPTPVTPETSSLARRSTPERLRRRLRGDLDAIVLQSIQKEPADRYRTAGELAADLSRHLAGRAVVARGQPRLYETRLWIRRHRIAAVTGLLGLLTGAVTLGLLSGRSPGLPYLEEGYRAAALGTYAEAVRHFQTALSLDSSLIQAAIHGAEAAAWDEDYATGVVLFEHMRRLAPGAPTMDRLLAGAYEAWRVRSPTLAAYADSLEAHAPGSVESEFYRARNAWQSGDFATALRFYRRVADHDESRRWGRGPCYACYARDQVVTSLVWLDSLEAAREEAEALTRLQPNAATAWRTLAQVQQLLSEEDDGAFRRVLALDPAGADYAAEWLSHRAIRAADFATADEVLRGRMRTAPPGREERSTGHLAMSLRYQERWDEAMRVAAEFRATNSDSVAPGSAPPTAVHEAQTLFESGQLARAEALYDSMARFETRDQASSASNRMWHLTHRADVLAAMGDTVGLRAAVDSLRALAPFSGLARDQRLTHHVDGLLREARGDLAGAERAYRQAILSWNMGYTRTNYALARVLLATGRPEEAVRVLEPALRGSLEVNNSYLTHTAIHRMLARAWRQAGRPERAAPHEAWVARATVRNARAAG